MNEEERETALCDSEGPPVLRVSVENVDAPRLAAVPSLRFGLRIDAAGARAVQSVALHAQIRIATATRTYDARGRELLAELFGASGSGSDGGGRGGVPRSLLWTHAAAQVPAFTGHTDAVLPVTCTYDFEVAVAKYFHALPDGEVPLEFLFSGTIFYLAGDRLQAAMIPWDTDAEYRMPVRVWKEMMDHHFPGSAWLRLDRGVFDRLYAYKVHHTLGTWDDVVDSLLPSGGG